MLLDFLSYLLSNEICSINIVSTLMKKNMLDNNGKDKWHVQFQTHLE